MIIKFDPHVIVRAEERGTTTLEIEEVINTGVPTSAKFNRSGKSKVYKYQENRNGKYYEQKKVEVIFVQENDAIIVITVYVFMEDGRRKMQIQYNDKTDLLYIRLDETKQSIINKRASEDVVLDMGENDHIVGIEIMDASKHLNLENLLPVKYVVHST